MSSEKVISNIKKAIKEHLDNNYAYVIINKINKLEQGSDSDGNN